MRVGAIYLWQNGMVMTFDETGRQMPDLQGRKTPELMEKLFENASQETIWHGFGDAGPCDWQQMKHKFSCPDENTVGTG